MRDFIFYPLCALVVGGIIWYALSFTPGTAPINISEGYTASGEDLQYFLVPNQLEFTLKKDEQIGQTVAVLTSNANKASVPPSAGICMRLGPDFEAAFEGKELEMTVRARVGDTSPTPRFQMGYFVVGTEGSGWKEFTPTDQYADYKIRLKKTAAQGKTRGDYAGIWPDIDGKGRTLNVASITVKLAPQN